MQAKNMKIFSSVVSMPFCFNVSFANSIDFVLSASAMSIALCVVGAKFSCFEANSIIFSSGFTGVLPKYPKTILPYPSAIFCHLPKITLLKAC